MAKNIDQTRDLQGRPYARLSDLKPGDIVIVDAGFTCIHAWSQRTIQRRKDGELYIWCSGPDYEDGEGKHKLTSHGLDGQLADDSDILIGIYRKEDFDNV